MPSKSNRFSPFPTRLIRKQAFQVYFIVEWSQIPNLAAGQLQALQHKTSRQVAVVCYCLCYLQWLWFFIRMLSHSRKFVDDLVSGILALDLPSTGWPSPPPPTSPTPPPSHTRSSPGCHTLHFIIIIDRFDIALFTAFEQIHCAHVVRDFEWVTASPYPPPLKTLKKNYSTFFNINRSDVLTALFDCYMAGATWNCCRVGARSVYVIQTCTSLQCHFIRRDIDRMHVWLVVTYHLHIWQNDRDLLRAPAVTRGWNGYRNKNQNRKLTLEKNIFPPLLPGIDPRTIPSRVDAFLVPPSFFSVSNFSSSTFDSYI